MASDANRALMVASMLLAGRTGNKIPTDPEYIKRVAYLNHRPDFSYLLESDFIRLIGDASKALASCKQDATPETETETEERQRHKDRFAKFWEVYPKKRKKGDAEKAFKAISPDGGLLDNMLEAVTRQRTSTDWRKENGKYIPYPATWLRARCWEDSTEVEVDQGIPQGSAHNMAVMERILNEQD